jgi:hypothetical protein
LFLFERETGKPIYPIEEKPVSTKKESFRNVVSYSHQSIDGYRQQSVMRREVVSWNAKITSSNKRSLSTHILFGDLSYKTPGGLTKSQCLTNPKADLFFIVENLLNETYSLGNDINTAAGRFYNAAPGVNYLAGVSFQFVFQNKL